MVWNKTVSEIARRRELALEQGGHEAITRQHSQGRLTVRERIAALLDPDSFEEEGPIAGTPVRSEEGDLVGYIPANYVLGFGRLDQRLIVLGGEDFTLKGGSPNAAGLRKSVYAEHLATEYRIPLVRFLEGGGGSVRPSGGGTVGEPLHTDPRFKVIAEAMGEIPIASIAAGPVAGFPAGRLVASHFSVLVRGLGQVMTGGPALVERALGRKLSKEDLGGADLHFSSGIVDNIVNTEAEAFDQVKQFLSYMPSNAWTLPPRLPITDPVDRIEEALLDIIPAEPNAAFDMRKIIESVLDRDSFFEMTKGFGPEAIAGLARLAGQPVGVLANDCCFYAGSMTAAAAQKTRRMIELCDSFHLPILNFVDEPGFMIGPDAEIAATIRYGMAAVAAAATSSVPWASVQIRKCFGVAGAAHFGPNNYTLLWPSAESGALPLEGGVMVAYGKEIAAAIDPIAKRTELEQQLRKARSPFPRAESFAVNDIIDPRQTRPLLCKWVDRIQTRLAETASPKTFMMRP